MRVIYEFDCTDDENDQYELSIYAKAPKMYAALEEISDIMRGIRKGNIEISVDDIEEKISDILWKSGIHEID